MLIKKLFIIFCIGLCLNLLLMPTIKSAKAWTDGPNLGVNTTAAVGTVTTVPPVAVSAGANSLTAGGIFTQIGRDLKKFIENNWKGTLLSASKIAALKLVQVATQAIIGAGGGGGIVTDWNNYLYTSPQQRALAQMDSFFNTVSKGRASSLNYEGVGARNHDRYLVNESLRGINGNEFSTTLPEVISDPNKLFGNGNMRGIMTYMQCANNVACYTMTAQAQYDIELAKAKLIAEKEQDRGFLPKKSTDGKIVQPASIISAAFAAADQYGATLIMEADPNGDDYSGAAKEIIGGAVLSIASRSLDYATADSKGKAAAQNRNDSFPFSISYSSNKTSGGQLNVGFRGITTSTNPATQSKTTSKSVGSMLNNVGAVTFQAAATSAIQTACAAIPLNAGTKTVSIDGRKYNCTTLTLSAIQ